MACDREVWVAEGAEGQVLPLLDAHLKAKGLDADEAQYLRVAAEERLLARYDRPARPLVLESWEAQLLLGILDVFRQRRSGRATDSAPLPPGGSVRRPRHDLLASPDVTGPDRIARRARLEPFDADDCGRSGWFT